MFKIEDLRYYRNNSNNSRLNIMTIDYGYIDLEKVTCVLRRIIMFLDSKQRD